MALELWILLLGAQVHLVPVDEYGQFHDYRTSGIPLGPETLIRTGENEAGLFLLILIKTVPLRIL